MELQGVVYFYCSYKTLDFAFAPGLVFEGENYGRCTQKGAGEEGRSGES